MGRNGEEFGECCITHPDDVGQNGCDEGAREGEPGKGTTCTEEVVRPQCSTQGAEGWM